MQVVGSRHRDFARRGWPAARPSGAAVGYGAGQRLVRDQKLGGQVGAASDLETRQRAAQTRIVSNKVAESHVGGIDLAPR
jgi:hypothetical protein